MDKETRSAIERATQRARKLLEEDFREQLEGTYDVLLDGTVAAEAGEHLQPRERVRREKIVAAIEHKGASGMKPAEAVADYLRDAAFTTLNRFAALKMLEARELVQECITRGEQSSGYKEFCGLAPGVASLNLGYALYVESLFDELSTEVKVLFDRRDPATVLWPRRQAFAALLEVLNAHELANVWGEDETIGWVYQYFNGGDERRAMRDASQAPRNSRELAVRNQFFTPRYVVQFLVDNTLGRTWLEMHGEESALATSCEFWVRPTEPGPPRVRKDPRDLRVLDPACGSGHFLLYSFDLLLTIYEEAWSVPGAALREVYPTLEALKRAVPALILEQNLHGVDIDPRAAQIAALALWLRAQRAWKDFGIPGAERPHIHRTGIVIAEPIPADAVLLDAFASELRPPLLGELFRKMVAETRLAAELGTLLRLEKTLADDLDAARKAWKAQQRNGFLPGLEPPRKQGELDLSGIDDGRFFHDAEERILAALARFADAASGSANVRRRLFAGDAAQGMALIDLVRTKHDVILMNPPFGYAPHSYAAALDARITDIDALFVQRAVGALVPAGLIGVITNRTQLMKPSLAEFRRECFVQQGRLTLCADLGQGVLDAMVETAAFVVVANDGGTTRAPCVFLNALGDSDKESAVRQWVRGSGGNVRTVVPEAFTLLPDVRFSHWIHPFFMDLLANARRLEADQHVAFGLSTTDNFRFVRLRWEIAPGDVVNYSPQARVDGWVPFAKGGEYSPYDGDIHLLVDWHREGAALRAMPGAPLRNEALYGRPGLTYSKRTASAFAPRVLSEGCIAEVNGPMIVPRSTGYSMDSVSALAVLSSRVVAYLVDALVAAGDTSTAYGAAKDYIPGVIGAVPIPQHVSQKARDAVGRAVQIRRQLDSLEETSIDYFGPWSLTSGRPWDETRFKRSGSRRVQLIVEGITSAWAANDEVERAFCVPDDAMVELESAVAERHVTQTTEAGRRTLHELAAMRTEDVVRSAIAQGITRKSVTKNAFRFDRRLELIATLSHASLADTAEVLAQDYCVREEALIDERSYAFGILIGRWQGKALVDVVATRGLFDALPKVAPAAQHSGAIAAGRVGSHNTGIIVDDEGHPQDIGRVSALLAAIGVIDAAHEDVAEVREFFARDFSTWHIARHTKSRRKAPVYWQITTASTLYSVWLFSDAVMSDTLYVVQNEYVAKKLAHEERRLAEIRTLLDRKAADALAAYVDELRSLLAELKLVVPLWRPTLADGFVIALSPLWRLFAGDRAWQQELRGVWDELCAEEYEWSQMAMHLWPERVVPKCADDRSLAIAHGLEDVFWVENESGKWSKRVQPTRSVSELVSERTSPTVKAALKSLLEAPAAAGSGKGRGKRTKRT